MQCFFTISIENSFAVVGIAKEVGVIQSGSTILIDTYISYYSGSTYQSWFSTQINDDKWIRPGAEGFNSNVNGGYKYLKFNQPLPIDLDTITLKESYERMLVIDSANKDIILYYFEVKESNNFTESQKQILREQNSNISVIAITNP